MPIHLRGSTFKVLNENGPIAVGPEVERYVPLMLVQLKSPSAPFATALLGFVLTAGESQLVGAFHLAMTAGALSCAAAAASALVLIKNTIQAATLP